jgi:hypothetical protein
MGNRKVFREVLDVFGERKISCSYQDSNPDLNPHQEDIRRSETVVPDILNLRTRWRWVVSFTPRPLLSSGKRLQHLWNGMEGGPLSQSGSLIESSWNVMAHGDAREGKWRGNWRMEWVASTFHTTSEHCVSRITTAGAHTSAASSRLNWRPRRYKWTSPFRRKTKSGFCACAITFQTQSTTWGSCVFQPVT